MTEEEKDNGLESLFRKRLEENETVAGKDLYGRFMRRLDRREFLRFNLSRFNIYYLAAAAATLAVVVSLVLGGQESSDASVVLQQEVIQAAGAATEESRDVSNIPEGESGTTVATEASAAAGVAVAETVSRGVIAPKETVIGTDRTGKGSTIIKKISKDDMHLAATAEMASLTASVTSGCVPLHVRFSCNAGEKSSVIWSFGDGGKAGNCNTDYIYDIPGIYSVALTITDSRGRSSAATTVIEVWDRPKAAFEIRQNDSPGDSDKLLFVNLSSGAVDYLWDFGDETFSTLSDPSYRYDRQGMYDVMLVAYSANGCADSVIVNDVFTDKGMYLRFPNAFVPNSGGPTGGYYNRRTDEENQVFHPVASGVAAYNLKIYSKAGFLVFESDDIDMGWDGYNKGQLCSPGVYLWKIRGTYLNGQPIIMAGDVTLINY